MLGNNSEGNFIVDVNELGPLIEQKIGLPSRSDYCVFESFHPFVDLTTLLCCAIVRI